MAAVTQSTDSATKPLTFRRYKDGDDKPLPWQ